jgi:protein-L-isoaspartate(D-aspartate) O-methyltransferase
VTPLALGLLAALVALGGACTTGGRVDGGPATTPEEDDLVAKRKEMVRTQIAGRGVADPRVLAALENVPRERFVPDSQQRYAFSDGPLPIGHEQTISQPYIVALMTELLEPHEGMRVLEVGTGSGYQAAILGEVVGSVYTIEIIEALGEQATGLLQELGYDNVHVRIGDGFDGWPEEAPFDGIMVTAAPTNIPQPLLDQLAVGGRLVIPVGRLNQDLLVVTRTESGFQRRTITGVRFVPMTGKAERTPN